MIGPRPCHRKATRQHNLRLHMGRTWLLYCQPRCWMKRYRFRDRSNETRCTRAVGRLRKPYQRSAKLALHLGCVHDRDGALSIISFELARLTH